MVLKDLIIQLEELEDQLGKLLQLIMGILITHLYKVINDRRQWCQIINLWVKIAMALLFIHLQILIFIKISTIVLEEHNLISGVEELECHPEVKAKMQNQIRIHWLESMAILEKELLPLEEMQMKYLTNYFRHK